MNPPFQTTALLCPPPQPWTPERSNFAGKRWGECLCTCQVPFLQDREGGRRLSLHTAQPSPANGSSPSPDGGAASLFRRGGLCSSKLSFSGHFNGQSWNYIYQTRILTRILKWRCEKCVSGNISSNNGFNKSCKALCSCYFKAGKRREEIFESVALDRQTLIVLNGMTGRSSPPPVTQRMEWTLRQN